MKAKVLHHGYRPIDVAKALAKTPTLVKIPPKMRTFRQPYFVASAPANGPAIVAGTGLSMGYVTSVVMVAFYFEKKRALTTGLSVCGSGIGTFLFAPLFEYLIEEYTCPFPFFGRSKF
jgi:hypothetical protein